MYEFEIKGEKYSIPLFVDLPLGALRKARKTDNELDATFELLEGAIGVDSQAMAALDTLTIDEFKTWFESWAGGATVGESSGSES
jgi:hypothetical protein